MSMTMKKKQIKKEKKNEKNLVIHIKLYLTNFN